MPVRMTCQAGVIFHLEEQDIKALVTFLLKREKDG